MSELSEEESEGDRYFASLHFPSEDLAVVTNGRGSLHILETGDRATTQSWLVISFFSSVFVSLMSTSIYFQPCFLYDRGTRVM